MIGKDLLPQTGFNQFVGFRLIEWDVDYACIALELEAQHMNGLNIAHGGVLLSALDFACGMSGSYQPPPMERRYCVTVSLSTHFINPLRDGHLRATAHRIGGGKSIFFAESEIFDASNTRIATASGAFRLLPNKPLT